MLLRVPAMKKHDFLVETTHYQGMNRRTLIHVYKNLQRMESRPLCVLFNGREDAQSSRKCSTTIFQRDYWFLAVTHGVKK